MNASATAPPEKPAEPPAKGELLSYTGAVKDKDTGKPIVTTPSGLKYVDLVAGTGAAVKQGDHVSVNYVGKLLDGTKFDASADHGGTFDYVQGVTSLIAGWTEGVQLMVEGEKTRFWIPESLAYKGQPGAPAGMLVFDVELIKIR